MQLDEATQRIAEELNKAVVVFGTDLSVIAFSVHDGEVDSGRLAIILSRKATPQAAEMISQSKAKNSRDPVVLPPYREVAARILMPLRHNEQLFGYLSFSEVGEITEETLQVYSDRLARASETLGTILAYRALEQRNSVTTNRELLHELLGPDERLRAESAVTLLTDGHLAKSDHYSTIVLRHRGVESGADAQLLELEDLLREVVRASIFTAFGSMAGSVAVAVIPGTVGVAQIESVLTRNDNVDVAAGIGGRRETLEQIVDAYREARIAAEAVVRLPGHSGSTASWEHLGLDRVLLQLPLHELRLSDLPDGVTRLLSIDSGINLAHTLNAYLSCGGRAQETARQLHIHRSTLYYRLDRIRKITDLDLADGDIRRELHTGLRIAQLSGNWKP